MAALSRHAPRGAAVETPVSHRDKENDITEYEKERKQTRKAFHDQVELALIAKGHADVALLRPLFTSDVLPPLIPPSQRSSERLHKKQTGVSRSRGPLRRNKRHGKEDVCALPSTANGRGLGKTVRTSLVFSFLYFLPELCHFYVDQLHRVRNWARKRN
jgi:hypothetical protein